MTREQKIAKAQKLREQGLTYREIGERLGYKGNTAPSGYKLCHPDKAREWRAKDNANRHEQKLAWQNLKDHSDEGRVRCTKCDELGGAGSARAHADPYVCEDCIAWGAHDKYRALERLWNEGKTYPQIMAELGWSKGMVALYTDRAREAGYDLPYRRQWAQPKFPDLARAA